MATGLGIDVGSESIKVVQAQVSRTGVTVTKALKIPRQQTVLDAPTEDNGALIPLDLGQELKRAGLRRSGTLGISGREVVLKYLTTPPVPPDKLKMFIDMEIGGKLTAKAGQSQPVTYDFRLLNMAAGGLRGDLIIMAGVCKNAYLFGIHSSLKAAGISAEEITPSCFGLVNAYLRTQKIPEKETVVLVEVGHELLEIAILEEDRLYFARSAPGGGKKFTTALDKVLKNGIPNAAAFKHERARLYPEGAQIPNKQELLFQAALKEGAENIAGAIRSSIMFCRTQAKMPKLDYQRVFISGGGARLKGLREYLEKKTGRPVQTLNLYEGLDLRKLDAASARCFEGEVADMSVALGLAVIDAVPNSFHFRMVPEKIIKQRIFVRKTLFGAAAGVVLMAGLWPQIQSASAAATLAKANVEVFDKKQEKAKREKREFEREVEQSRALKQQLDYYLFQTRMGPRYLDLFTAIRAETPHDISLVSIGPPDSGGSTMIGAQRESKDAPVQKFVVKGFYDPNIYPDTKFNDEWELMRKKLLLVPGISKANLDLVPDDGGAAKPGLKSFQLSIVLDGPNMLALAQTPAGVSGSGKAATPAPAAGGVKP